MLAVALVLVDPGEAEPRDDAVQPGLLHLGGPVGADFPGLHPLADDLAVVPVLRVPEVVVERALDEEEAGPVDVLPGGTRGDKDILRTNVLSE